MAIEIQPSPEKAQAAPAAKVPAPEAPPAAPRGEPDPVAAGRRRAWVASLALFALGSVFLLWAFRDAIVTAVAIWADSPTYGYAFFILPISGFLIYRQRGRLAQLAPAAAPWALVPLLGAIALWMLGNLANIMAVQQLAFVAIWQSLFLAVMGWRATWTVLFPLFYVFFAVPLGTEIIPHLQDITAHIVVRLLRLSGMPVFLDGFYIQIPSGSFLIAEACSGLRFLIVCIALGALIAYLYFRSWKRRALFVLLSVVVPIIANGLRAYGIIMLADLSDYRIAAGVDHVVYGFIFLSVIILTLVGIASLMREDPAPAPAAPAPAVPRSARPGALAGQVLAGALAVAAVLAGQAWVAGAKAPPAGPLAAPLEGPALASAWTLSAAAPAWTAHFAQPDATLAQSFSDGGGDPIDLQAAYYAYQREGSEALSELNTLLVGRSAWQPASLRERTVSLNGGSLPVVEMVIRNGDEVRVVWYWYRIGGSTTNSRVVGKLLEMKAMLLGGNRAAFLVAVSAPVTDDESDAAAALERFLNANLDRTAGLVHVRKREP